MWQPEEEERGHLHESVKQTTVDQEGCSSGDGLPHNGQRFSILPVDISGMCNGDAGND